MAFEYRLTGQNTPFYGFPVLDITQAVQVDTNNLYEPGIIVVVKNGTSWALAEYVQIDSNGCSKGRALVSDCTTSGHKAYNVIEAQLAHGLLPVLRGVALATIAASKFGWMVIGGYVEQADINGSANEGGLLTISKAASGTFMNAQSIANATVLANATFHYGLAISRGSLTASGLASISLMGIWG